MRPPESLAEEKYLSTACKAVEISFKALGDKYETPRVFSRG